MTKLFGVLGALFFSIAAVPAAWKTLKSKEHSGAPLSLGIMILLGIIFMYLYLYLSFGFDLIVTASYLVEGISWIIILYYAIKHRISKSIICK